MNNISLSPTRISKYTVEAKRALLKLGHATNAEILQELQLKFPQVSATTVHRITARLCERGEIGLAPSDLNNALRYDAIATRHDHFMCSKCGMLRDAILTIALRPAIEAAIGSDCSITGNLTISGVCKHCYKELYG